MKIRELHQKSKEELPKLLQEKRSRILSLRFDLAGGRVKNIRELRSTRKDIARILTILNQSNGNAKKTIKG